MSTYTTEWEDEQENQLLTIEIDYTYTEPETLCGWLECPGQIDLHSAKVVAAEFYDDDGNTTLSLDRNSMDQRYDYLDDRAFEFVEDQNDHWHGLADRLVEAAEDE